MIFRFVSILGERYTHGHVYDFVEQLKLNPKKLKVLGDGSQKKSYLHVEDCITAITIAIHKSNKRVNGFQSKKKYTNIMVKYIRKKWT